MAYGKLKSLCDHNKKQDRRWKAEQPLATLDP